MQICEWIKNRGKKQHRPLLVEVPNSDNGPFSGTQRRRHWNCFNERRRRTTNEKLHGISISFFVCFSFFLLSLWIWILFLFLSWVWLKSCVACTFLKLLVDYWIRDLNIKLCLMLSCLLDFIMCWLFSASSPLNMKLENFDYIWEMDLNWPIGLNNVGFKFILIC